MYELSFFLLIIAVFIAYYGTLAFVFHHYSEKYRKEDMKKGIYPSPMIVAQVEVWHVIMFALAFLPFVFMFIFIILYT